ncbi:MAG TPA: DUF4159 domain-containing protein, partial [Blastocatellia bacterium]
MTRFVGLSIVLLFLMLHAAGQSRLGAVPHYYGDRRHEKQNEKKPGEFTFVRTIYHSASRGYRGGSWAVDYPDADNHFIVGVRDWAGTNLNISSEPQQIQILDDDLFNYPLIYFVEPGYLELSGEEAERLREYILRGGSLFLDDFWGEYEW